MWESGTKKGREEMIPTLRTQDIRIGMFEKPLPGFPEMQPGIYVLISCHLHSCDCGQCPPFSGKTMIKCENLQHAQNVLAILSKYVQGRKMPKTQDAVTKMIEQLRPIL